MFHVLVLFLFFVWFYYDCWLFTFALCLLVFLFWWLIYLICLFVVFVVFSCCLLIVFCLDCSGWNECFWSCVCLCCCWLRLGCLGVFVLIACYLFSFTVVLCLLVCCLHLVTLFGVLLCFWIDCCFAGLDVCMFIGVFVYLFCGCLVLILCCFSCCGCLFLVFRCVLLVVWFFGVC